MKEYSNCPNPECGESWSIEELSFQVCGACGYPNHEEYDDDDIDIDDFIFDYEQGDDSDDDDYEENDEILFNHLM